MKTELDEVRALVLHGIGQTKRELYALKSVFNTKPPDVVELARSVRVSLKRILQVLDTLGDEL